MTVTIQVYETYQEAEVLALYASVGWTNYTQNPQMLRSAFKHSLKVLAAFEGEQLVGIIRVVGDGYSIVFIQDLLIHPNFQRRGLGQKLLNLIVSEFSKVYQLHLMTDDTEKTQLFYESLGFERVNQIGIRAFTRLRQ
ncbi:GNAT family N-acetyltransferase [Fundicoccus sp. Sow4_D5]|uniref:GNAT family N-acetyltransferase n=1 Tax=unclassified Fundicoccus TaxID=2761543 RepID=UPI003F8F3CEA